MNKSLVYGAMAALLAGTAGASFAGTADGQGAQKRNLTVSTGSSAMDCEPGDEVARQGFVILNAAGQPDMADKIVGVVSLKEGTPNTTYTVFLAVDDMCMMQDTLTTNNQGNGNGQIDFDMGMAGEYFVLLQPMDMASDTLASTPVVLR